MIDPLWQVYCPTCQYPAKRQPNREWRFTCTRDWCRTSFTVTNVGLAARALAMREARIHEFQQQCFRTAPIL